MINEHDTPEEVWATIEDDELYAAMMEQDLRPSPDVWMPKHSMQEIYDIGEHESTHPWMY